MRIEHHFTLLGRKVRDRVTGFSGVMTCISFDLYGCVQGVVTPPQNKEGVLAESKWFDTTRLEATEAKTVMPVPSFERQVVNGCQDKPIR